MQPRFELQFMSSDFFAVVLVIWGVLGIAFPSRMAKLGTWGLEGKGKNSGSGVRPTKKKIRATKILGMLGLSLGIIFMIY